MKRYEGRVVLVTGGATGLGRAMTERFAAESAIVAICDVSDAVKETADVVSAATEAEVTAAIVDVTSSGDVDGWVGDVLGLYGKIDVLVNNAGVFRNRRIESITDQEWDSVLDVSLRGSFNCSRAVIPPMTVAGYGRILFMASIAWRGQFGGANYSAAKAGVVGLARAIAVETASRGITSNVIAPGTFDTPMTASVKASVREQLAAEIPMGRIGRPEEIAEAATFLCSEAAGYITGVVLDVDGGASVGVTLK